MSVDASTPVHRPESGNAEKLNVLAVVAFVLAILVAGQIVGFGSVTLAIFAVGVMALSEAPQCCSPNFLRSPGQVSAGSCRW